MFTSLKAFLHMTLIVWKKSTQKIFTTDALMPGQGGGGLSGGSGRGLGAAERCGWLLVPRECSGGAGGGPEGGGARFCFCWVSCAGLTGAYCLWGEATGWICGWGVCSCFCAAYAGMGGGFTAGRTMLCLDRAEQDGLAWGEDFTCGRMFTVILHSNGEMQCVFMVCVHHVLLYQVVWLLFLQQERWVGVTVHMIVSTSRPVLSPGWTPVRYRHTHSSL